MGVAEILGDGLLVFWNTPDDVNEHEAKACASALAQHQVLASLNRELKRFQIPPITTRIGLHTGSVLSGNIGSETKMKFGCIGDPINLASRLEGLCKVYGVGVICSRETHDALPADAGFVCRQLDFVQVKGKRIATRIYELIGVNNAAYCSEGTQVSRTALETSAKALVNFDSKHFNPLSFR